MDRGDCPDVDLERLPLKVGCGATTQSLAKFKRQLRTITEEDTLPQYRVELREIRVPGGNGRPRMETSVILLPRSESDEERLCASDRQLQDSDPVSIG